MDKKHNIETRVRDLGELQPWNHDFLLPYGIRTRPGVQVSHGKNHVKLDRIRPILDLIDLKGKKVLDVGCNEGFFSLHMANAGAHVLGIDVDEKRIEKARFVAATIEDKPDVRFDVIDIYSDKFMGLPNFDLCLCMGFVHRIPDPFRALAALAKHSDTIIFEWKALKFGPHDDSFAYFSQKNTNIKDYYGTEYWILSYATLEVIMQRFGFKYFYRIDDPSQKRAIMVTSRYHHSLFDRPSIIARQPRLISIFRHTKRYARTVLGIITGRVNA